MSTMSILGWKRAHRVTGPGKDKNVLGKEGQKKKKKKNHLLYCEGLPGGASSKESSCQCRRHKRHAVPFLDQEDPLEEGTATHSSVLAWRIP